MTRPSEQVQQSHSQRSLFVAALLLLFCLSFGRMQAQPVISYIIPDVGAAGMTVAIDIIAPNTANVDGSYFSMTDSIFNNNASDGFRLECVRPADKWKISFSPIVSSWNGRVLSAVAFISPNCLPNSADWRLLSDEWRIPIQIFNPNLIPNFKRNIDTFYIVNPTHIGDLSSVSSTVFGSGGAMGVRSRRGAMVVDSIILKNSAYTFSTSDPDGVASNGNQGFLPVVLLAQGRIVGSGSSSKMSVDATNADGGPGGGGGAGAFCDYVTPTTNKGSAGGNGYTGGGRGGRNGTGLSSPAHNSYGVSSGTVDVTGAGNSLNSTLGAITDGYEAAGGGTGHPFGSSGSCCNDGSTCTPQGGYGGASGGRQVVPGSAGGNKTKGTSTNAGGDNGGYPCGNTMNVPLAGGSGGAGGNPQTVNGCAGAGGGGGGALQIYARSVSSVLCSAIGAAGTTGSPNGGSGSGGGINISSKLASTGVAVTVAGGKGTLIAAGGEGRVRTDGSVAIDAGRSDASPDYFGPTIDTISSVKGPFTLNGRGRAGDTINLYMKSDISAWTLLAEIRVSPSNTWSCSVSYGTAENELSFVAAQRVTNASTSSRTAEPKYILSSAAAAVVKIVKIAEVSCDSVRDIGTVNCSNGGVRLDTFYIRNLGNIPVDIDSAAFANGTIGFSIVEPNPMKKVTIAKKDSIRVIVRFQAAAFQAGKVRDRIIINFPSGTSPRTLPVDYVATIDTVGLSFINVSANTESRNPYSIDFNRVCANRGATQIHAIRNISKTDATIKSFKTAGNNGVFLASIEKLSLSANDTAQFVIKVPPGNKGVYYDTLLINMTTSDGCTMNYRIPLALTLVETLVFGYDHAMEDFGFVKVGKTVTRRFIIRNDGTGLDSAYFKTVPTVSAPWTLNMVAPDTVPRVLAPGDSIVFTLSFTPDASQTYQFNLNWPVEEQGASCANTVSFHPQGIGTTSSIVPTTDTVRFGSVYRCTVRLDSFWLKNVGSTSGKVFKPATISGPDAARFRVTKQPSADTTLNTTKDSVLYVIEFSGDPADTTASLKTAQVEIKVFDDSAHTIIIPISASLQRSKLQVGSVAPFNNAPVNSLSSHQLELTNPTDTLICIADIKSQHSEIQVVPNSIDITARKTIALAVNVIPTSLADIKDTLTIYVNCPCVDSIIVPVLVHPSNNDLQFNPTRIAFDTVKVCQVVAPIGISVQNIDPLGQGFLDSVKLIGPDTSVFSLSYNFKNFPYIIQPKATELDLIKVAYNGAGTPAGAKNASLVLNYHINNQSYVDTLPIFAFRLVPIHLDSAYLDFGSVKQGQNKTLPVYVYNDYSQSVEVQFNYGSNPRHVFQPTGGVLSPPRKSKDSMNIEFIADSTGDFRDTLYVRYFVATLGCTDSIPLQMHGSVLPGVNYRVWLDKSIVVDPTDNDVKIHVFAALDTAVNYGNSLQFSARIDIPADMFHPFRVEDAVGRFIPDAAVVGNRQGLILSIDTLAAPLTPLATKLATISGAAMLGGQVCDSLYLVSFNWTNSGAHPTTISNPGKGNGEYCTTVCTTGGNRLIGTTSTPLQMMIAPNPVSEHLNIMVRSVEAGLYCFDVINETGQTVHSFQHNAQANQTYEFNRSLQDLGSGVYTLRLSTETRSLQIPLVLIK